MYTWDYFWGVFNFLGPRLHFETSRISNKSAANHAGRLSFQLTRANMFRLLGFLQVGLQPFGPSKRPFFGEILEHLGHFWGPSEGNYDMKRLDTLANGTCSSWLYSSISPHHVESVMVFPTIPEGIPLCWGIYVAMI